MQEAADQIRAHYRKKGFLEREVFNVDKNFDWGNFINSTGNFSLFSEQKIIELRLSSHRLDDAGKKALHSYLEDPSSDYLLLILSPKIDAPTFKTKWFSQIEKAGAVLQIWPVTRENLQPWLEQRLRREGIQAERSAVQLLADKVEGNLLAAMQEIEKLKLLANVEDGELIKLDANTVLKVVADSSRYSVYHLVDAALMGDAVRAQRMLQGLRNEGLFPLLIVSAISNELRSLLPMLEKRQRGEAIASILQAGRVWFNRKSAVTKALKQLKSEQVWHMLDHCKLIDQSIKGMSSANTWDELSLLLLNLSGTPSVLVPQAN